MNQELKAKWVAALRSGEYQQATGALKVLDGYCCLGVFCVVAGLPISANGVGVEDGTYNGTYKPLVDAIGKGALTRLWGKNDDRVPFPKIADWIEIKL